jgi:hypothetical protein
MKVVVVEEEKPLITSVATSSSLSYEDDPLDNLGPVWYSSSS